MGVVSMNKALIFFSGILLCFLGAMAILFAGGGLEARSDAEPHAGPATVSVPSDPGIGESDESIAFSFLDQNGKRFASKSLDGKVWVGSVFFSSCPSTCRAQNMKVAELQERYKDQPVEFVSLTCDPDVDDSATLNQYAAKFSADAERWHFLTGDLEQIKRVGGNRLGVAVDGKVHSDRLVLFDRDGKRVDSFRSLDVDQFQALKKEIDRQLARPAKVDASPKGDGSGASSDGESGGDGQTIDELEEDPKDDQQSEAVESDAGK